MKKITSLLSVLCFINLQGKAQTFDDLIVKAWNKDKNLHAKNFQLKSAELSLKEAQAMYGPTIGVGFQYTLAVGGRTIPFPIGDLFNPVYETLNKVTQSEKFKSVENVEVNFLPNNFYDAKFSVQQAIYYPDLAINKSLKENQLSLKALEIKAYKRLLSKEVMQATINEVLAMESIKIYEEASQLLSEAKRSTESMLKNGIALPSSLSRIEAQIADINAQKISAANDKKNAILYLFYLCGDTLALRYKASLESLPSTIANIGQREEIAQLDVAQNMIELSSKKEHQFYKPKIGAQLDFGSQAFNFGFTPYALLGLNLQMNLYDNQRHKMRQEIAKLAIDENHSKMDQVTEQLDLQIVIGKNNLQAALDQANTFKPRIDASKKLYKEVYTKYKEGVSNYLELIDAQSQMTSTAIQYNLTKYNAWRKWVEYIYSTASYIIN